MAREPPEGRPEGRPGQRAGQRARATRAAEWPRLAGARGVTWRWEQPLVKHFRLNWDKLAQDRQFWNKDAPTYALWRAGVQKRDGFPDHYNKKRKADTFGFDYHMNAQ